MGDRTLVIVLAETREHEHTFDHFRRNLLDVFDADLALCVADNDREDTSNPFYATARHVWTLPEPDDWGDVFDRFQRDAGVDGEWRQLLSIGNQWLGGVRGERAHPGSAGILLAFRWFLAQTLRSGDVLDRYDRFVVTRSDFVHLTPHVPPAMLDPGYVWIPRSQDHGGFTDRHIVVGRDDILDVLSVADPIVLEPDALYERMRHRDDWNLERVVKAHFDRIGVSPRVRRYPYSMYTVRSQGGTTRWSRGRYDDELGYHVKYVGEYRSARIARAVSRGGGWTPARMRVAGDLATAERRASRGWARLRGVPHRI